MVVSVAIATASAYFFTRDLPSVYLARTTLLVGNAIFERNPTGNEFGLSQTLARAYANLALREPVAVATMAELGLQELPEYSARALPDGQFLEITVTDSNRELAQLVANELARQLIRQSPSGALTEEEIERQNFVRQQLADLQTKINSTNQEMTEKQAALADLSSASEIAAAQADLRALEERLSVLQGNYATLLANTEQGATNTLTVFEPAALPVVPVGPRRTLIILAAALAGLVLSTGAAYLIEFLDDTLRTPEDVSRLLPYPIIGYISDMPRTKTGILSVADQPRSPLAEAFRSLRTNLEFTSVDRQLKTILITSPTPGDGKSSIAFNLGLIMAQGGKRVVLLDADLRRPSLHRILGIPNRDGLSDLFRGHLQAADVTRPWRKDNVTAVTSGTLPPNPTELLGSKRMDQILADLKEIADVVIIDAPPFFVTDAWVLASKVDGVLLVIQANHARRNIVRSMLEQIRRVNAPIIGAVINRMAHTRGAYSRYSYLSYYYYSRDEAQAEGGAAGQLPAARPQRALQSVLRSLQKVSGRGPDGADESAAVEGPTNGHVHRVEVLPPASSDPPDSERTRVSLDLLYAISRELATQLDLRELMQRILQMTLDSVGATSGSMIVLDERGEALEGVLIYEGKTTVQTAEQLADVVERGLAGWVIENRRPVVLDNTHDDPRWLRRDWDENGAKTPRSAISVPLMANDRVVGVLTLVHPHAGHFTRDDLSMLTAIAVGISFSSQVYPN